MRQIELEITNPTGLHARPAKYLVSLAMKFKSNIRIQCGEKTVNAKSIVSVLTLGAVKGSHLDIQVDGEDEKFALAAIESAFNDGLGENELPEKVG
jgi:phosphotransferase system HPr (HPr) family protein